MELVGSVWKSTYHMASDRRPIAVSQTKLGFTAGVISNAEGEVLFLHLIWKGETSAVHAHVCDDLLLQDHRKYSHFQNAETFQRLCNELLLRVTTEKAKHGMYDVHPVLIIDQAEQHKMDTLIAAGFHIVLIPKKLTHIFQPADQHIIANIKSQSQNEMSKWRTDLFKIIMSSKLSRTCASRATRPCV
eukprot:PhM_4_TR9810/c0_g1_i3/m.21859